MKATEQWFPMVLFVMLYKVVLAVESVNKILKCDHSNESYWEAFPVVPYIMLYMVHCLHYGLLVYSAPQNGIFC